MEEKRHFSFDFKVVIGLVILTAGVVMLIDRLITPINIDIWEFWPVILILLGLGKIITGREKRCFGGGLFLIGLGVLFLLNNFNVLHFDIGDLWPLALVFVGYSIIKSGIFYRNNGDQSCQQSRCHQAFKGKSTNIDTDYIRLSAILGGGEYRFANKDLKGGDVTAIMGGCVIDLTEADIAGDSMIIDTFAMLGGIEIRVPAEWMVVIKATPILGGIDNKTVTSPQPHKQLIIKGTAFMGGIEIKN